MTTKVTKHQQKLFLLFYDFLYMEFKYSGKRYFPLFYKILALPFLGT